MKKVHIIVGIYLILASSVAFAILKPKSSNLESDKGLTKVQNFHYAEKGMATCQAITPECGVCYGEIINKECYVDKSVLSQSQLEIMGFGR